MGIPRNLVKLMLYCDIYYLIQLLNNLGLFTNTNCQGKCREFESHRPLQLFSNYLHCNNYLVGNLSAEDTLLGTLYFLQTPNMQPVR